MYMVSVQDDIPVYRTRYIMYCRNTKQLETLGGRSQPEPKDFLCSCNIYNIYHFAECTDTPELLNLLPDYFQVYIID